MTHYEPTEDDITTALDYVRNYFPPIEQFETLAFEGGDGSEEWTVRMNGDDFAGWCWGMYVLFAAHGYDYKDPWGLDTTP